MLLVTEASRRNGFLCYSGTIRVRTSFERFLIDLMNMQILCILLRFYSINSPWLRYF